MVDASSYVLYDAASGISTDSSGTITVPMTNTIALTTMKVSVTTNGGKETHTSDTFSLQVLEDCLSTATMPSVSDSNKVQMSSGSLTINAGVTQTSVSCATSSYVLTPATTGVTINSVSGQITVDSSLAIASTTLTVSATVGTQIISKVFTIEVYDCTSTVSFSNLPSD